MEAPVPGGATGAARVLARRATRLALIAAYGAVLLAPVLLTAGVVKPGAHGRVVVFADALGFAAMSLLALQVFSSGRWAATTRHFGLRAVLSLHRQAGAAVLVLVVAHVVLLLADDPTRLALLDVPTAPGRARAGVIALVGLLGLAYTSIRRARLGLSYQRWRALHLALTAAVIAGAFIHVMWVDSYTSLPVVRESILALVLVAAGALFWSRVAQPYNNAARRYRVLAVHPERGGAVTLQLEADGHRGVRFAPGQYARLRPAAAPYSLDDHPFTISSGAGRPDRPAFTVKALGDFSASLAHLRTGAEILVDGPHGEGFHDRRRRRGRLLIAAGIGITPAISVLRTAAERADQRPLVLVYGSRSWEDVTFREELTALERRLPNLRVVHVLSRPHPGWRGERGRVGAPLLAHVAPRDVAAWSALVCGPPAMVAEVQLDLLRSGMPLAAVQAEGFD
ncbi:MAG TPA: ferric reductase-like transmembrane domain-containing protein [Baekduia sp.]|jgi:predicted ferric reductase|nr:ferric reductase-like transmembrane domain-containing protein [Baekduia sp.]